MSKFQTFSRFLGIRTPIKFLKKITLRIGGVKMGKNVKIGKNVHFGNGVHLGDNVVIESGVKIMDKSTLNKNVTIKSNAVIGNCSIGPDTHIDVNAIVIGGLQGCVFGHNSYVGQYCVIDGSGGLEVGDYVHITGGTAIWTHSSIMQALRGDKLTDKSNVKRSPVVVGNNIWIGGNSTIYPGVRIGDCSAVLPNSVVNMEVKSYTVVGGAPAVFKRKISFDKNGNIDFLKD